MKFTSTHEWVKKEGNLSAVGITEYAAGELGDIVFVQLPEVGDNVVAGEAFAEVESVKAVESVLSPVTGIVKAINEEIIDSPELINEDAYSAWFVKVQVEQEGELISQQEYLDLIK
ncbi:MAG: glycine cleavage system protein GcvH [Clostridiales bacterium]|jgi:glycine cleavage system H protein|nr:glycine cleavage system protein GcvH [Clostridiales bacterium]